MYYPNNFPKDLEPHLITLLIALQELWEKNTTKKPFNWQKHIHSIQKNSVYVKAFKGKSPSIWWLQFILQRYSNKFSPEFLAFAHHSLIKTKMRSQSGIVPLTVFTKGVACPFNCVYCPSEPNVPKSYFSDEPAVMRAIRSGFDPFKQTQSRLIMFALSNHNIDKIELIVKGGTFSFLPRRYRTWFFKRLYDGCNGDTLKLLTSGKKSLDTARSLLEAQQKNENAPSRIIGVNIETRPDYINEKEILYLRKLGVTHVELGVQTLSDTIYKIIKRGHTVQSVVEATKLLKNAGFKVGYHLMLNLPGSTPDSDKKMVEQAFTDPRFMPDHLKLYPTTVTKFTPLATWYMEKKYIPYSFSHLVDVIVYFKSRVAPPWVRIGRLTRDITTHMMNEQLFPPNLREIIQKKLHEEGKKCQCIRCREIQLRQPQKPFRLREALYEASGGKEYFIEKIDANNRCLGFVRLRIAEGGAMVRELHVYGKALQLGAEEKKETQHRGLGEELLFRAETITKEKSIKSLSIISGIGVRNYYKKFGYQEKNTYMVKTLS